MTEAVSMTYSHISGRAGLLTQATSPGLTWMVSAEAVASMVARRRQGVIRAAIARSLQRGAGCEGKAWFRGELCWLLLVGK